MTKTDTSPPGAEVEESQSERGFGCLLTQPQPGGPGQAMCSESHWVANPVVPLLLNPGSWYLRLFGSLGDQGRSAEGDSER